MPKSTSSSHHGKTTMKTQKSSLDRTSKTTSNIQSKGPCHGTTTRSGCSTSSHHKSK